MTVDVASLQIRVQSLELEVANNRLDELSNKGRKAGKATDGLMSSFKRIAGPAALAAAAIFSLKKVIDVTREFNKLNGQLVAATGSAEGAKIAYEALNDFMISTPFNIKNLTDAFVTLVNSGLDPSERAMKAYGDWSAAMGRDISDLTNAVSGAVVGNTEAMKGFGVRMKTDGDTISASFRGVTTTIKNNAADIEKYLIGIAENNFAGTMEARLGTLDDAISTLGDQFDNLWLSISNTGAGDFITQVVLTIGEGIEELTAMIGSGQLQGYAKALLSDWVQVWDGIMDVVDWFMELWGKVPESFKVTSTSAVGNIVDSFKVLPTTIKGLVKRIAIEFSTLVEYAQAYGAGIRDSIVLKFKQLVDEAAIYSLAIAHSMNPFSDFDMRGELAKIEEQYAKSSSNIWQGVEDRVNKQRELRLSTIEDIDAEKQAALDNYNSQIEAADRLRLEYDKLKESRSGGDRLAQFAIKPDGDTGDKKSNPELDKLIESLMTEEEKIAESYQRRRAIIMANTLDGSTEQMELLSRLNDEYREAVLGNDVVTYEEQLTKLQEYWDRRIALIRENTQISEAERTALEADAAKKRNDQIESLETARYSNIFSATSQGFGGLADLAKTFAGEQSGTYKAMFAVSKGFAIATATMNMYTGISEAVKLGWPGMFPGIAAATAQGATALSNIKGSNFSGAYDKGGNIPAGSFGLVGEYGPEIINGPVNVTSRKSTEELLGKSGGGNNVQVNVINQSSGVSVDVQEKNSGESTQLDVIITEVKKSVSDDFNRGGELSTSLENRYGLRRGKK